MKSAPRNKGGTIATRFGLAKKPEGSIRLRPEQMMERKLMIDSRNQRTQKSAIKITNCILEATRVQQSSQILAPRLLPTTSISAQTAASDPLAQIDPKALPGLEKLMSLPDTSSERALAIRCLHEAFDARIATLKKKKKAVPADQSFLQEEDINKATQSYRIKKTKARRNKSGTSTNPTTSATTAESSDAYENGSGAFPMALQFRPASVGGNQTRRKKSGASTKASTATTSAELSDAYNNGSGAFQMTLAFRPAGGRGNQSL